MFNSMVQTKRQKPVRLCLRELTWVHLLTSAAKIEEQCSRKCNAIFHADVASNSLCVNMVLPSGVWRSNRNETWSKWHLVVERTLGRNRQHLILYSVRCVDIHCVDKVSIRLSVVSTKYRSIGCRWDWMLHDEVSSDQVSIPVSQP